MTRARTPLYAAATVIVLLGSAPRAARAETVDLPAAISAARASSPDIQQLENQLDSAYAKRRQALAPAEPTLSFAFNDLREPFNLSSVSSQVIQLTQPLGFPGRAFLNRSALGDQAEALGYQLRALQLQVSANVKQAYFNLQLSQRNIQLNGDTRLAYERILAIAKRKYETGLSTQVDYVNSQIALLSNQNDLTDLLSAERQARAQLNVLMKRSPEAPLEVAPIQMVYHPAIQLDAAIDRMLAGRNEIKSAKAQLSAAETTYKLAWMSVLPDFQLTAGTTFYRQPYASPFSSIPGTITETTPLDTVAFPTHTYMAGIQLTVPLWFLLNEREAVVGASHDRIAAEKGLDVVYNQSKIALEAAVDTVNASLAKVENYEKHLLPLSEQAFSLALVNYSAGKIDFQTLSDTASSRRTLRAGYATTVVNYLTAYTTYGQLIGEDL